MLESLLSSQGEDFEIHRKGEVHIVRGLANREKGSGSQYIGFLPGTDIAVGDLLIGTVSGNRHKVTDVSTDLLHGRALQVKAFFDDARNLGTSNITIGSMVNSAIQQGSPGAVQQVTFGPQEQQAVGMLIKAVEEVAARITLAGERQAELLAEIDTIKAQLKSPKPKSSIVRDALTSIKDNLQHYATLATTTAASIGVKDVIGRIAAYLGIGEE